MGQGSEDAAKDDDRAGNPNPGHQWRQSTIVLGIGGKSVRAQPKVNYDVIIILQYSISSANI